MKSLIKTYTYSVLVIALLVYSSSCKKNFGDVNTNPSVVVNPDIKFLLSYSEDRLATYQGTEWVWESMEQFWRFTQHITSSPYELSGNVNTRYTAFYQQILPNLFEIRRQIALKENKDAYQKMAAVTYIVQIVQAIKVTDVNGSIPYTEAEQGRYDSKFNPAYDTQETLFNTWLTELDNAIGTLSNNGLPTQETYGNADIYYKGDWTKWVKLANTLKLRIAARLENQDAARTKTIFQQVMQDAIGAINSDDAQLSYQSVDYLPFGGGGDINYRSARYASSSIIRFLKSAGDPRLPVYFEQNQLTGHFKDTLAAYNVTLPSFIDINDPLVSYQGGPADWTTDATRASYISNAFPVSQYSKYFLISAINRKFFSPRYNGATDGNFKDVMITNAESCLLIAEFIAKGYGNGIDTKGSAEDWYKKGITSSILTMNDIAKTAGSATAFSDDGSSTVSAYLGNANVKLNGVNDLERIYTQEYLNFYRNITEGFVFCRRTGYPKLNSTYYARETFNETIPRRFWTADPGEVNRTNWSGALQEQGFTPLTQDVQKLSVERVWYDKKAPDFGKGQ